MVRNGAPVLVVGGAGGSCIIMGVLQTIVNVVDFGLDIARAVDAERMDAACFFSDLGLEDARVSLMSQQELENRGHTINREGEYFITPLIEAAGFDPSSGRNLSFSDPRSEWGSDAQD